MLGVKSQGIGFFLKLFYKWMRRNIMSVELSREIEQPQRERLSSLLRNQKFLLLWLGSIFSGLSFSIYFLTKSWYVVDELGLKASLGLVLMAMTVPRVLLMMIGGVLADRFRRSTIMFSSLITRSVLLFGMVILLFFDLINIWILIGFAFCIGILDAFFWPANNAILPSIVTKEHLTRANSFLQSTNHITLIVGPMIAGWLITITSYEWVFGTITCLLIIGGILIFQVKESFDKPEVERRPSPLKDLQEGYRYLVHSPVLLNLMSISVFVNFFIAGPGTMAIPLIVEERLMGGAQDLSYLESTVAGGLILGAIIIGVLNLRSKRGLLIILRLTILGISIGLLGQVTSLWQAILVLAILGMGITVGDIPTRAIIQEETDSDKIGRVMGMMSTASNGLIPLSYGITSVALSFHLSISWILFYCGSLVILFSLFILWKFETLKTLD
jgi:DHA3 family macrolide efflux protein-like MFS transporter